MVTSPLVSVDDDDFDFDFGSSKASSRELADLLEEVKPKPAEPSAAEPTVASPSPLGPPAGAPSPNSSRSSPLLSASADSEYGVAGGAPWQLLAYAYRVLRISTSAEERAVLLHQDLEGSKRVLDEAHAALGRTIRDAANLHGFALPEAAVAEVAVALSSAESLASSRAELSRRAQRDNAMATARRESATASLDPVAAEQEKALADLDACEKERDAAQGALAEADARAREVLPNDLDAFRDAGAVLEAARERWRVIEERHREATRAYAEARRRALLQISRIAEAETAVEGARVEEKKQSRELRRQQEDAQRALRDAYAKLGQMVFDASIGQEHASGAFASVRRARESRATTVQMVDRLHELADAYDAEAYRKGKNAWYGVLAAVVLILLVIAATA